MFDPKEAGVSDEDWRKAIEHSHELRVSHTIEETHDSMSIVLDIPDELRELFAYKAGQFLSFKVPHQGKVLTRSYSLASSPDVDGEHKVTVKRVDDGRVSNWMNDAVRDGARLQVVPPAGLFVLVKGVPRNLFLWSGGSGITPCISIIKSALSTTTRHCRLVYANRDARSIIFERELEELLTRYPGRLEVIHSLDDVQGFLTQKDVAEYVGEDRDRDFYLCGPGAFMDTVETGLGALGIPRERIHVERFISPPDDHEPTPEPENAGQMGSGTLTLVLDGVTHEIPYESGEGILAAARRAGISPPFSCEEGYCSCCMAQLTSGEVSMTINDCLTPDLLEEGWVLTCQARCLTPNVKVEYPD
jgi:3-ketosteroid 9alpha-monooxygenase subunit B